MRHAVSGYAVFGSEPVDAAEIGFRFGRFDVNFRFGLRLRVVDEVASQ